MNIFNINYNGSLRSIINFVALLVFNIAAITVLRDISLNVTITDSAIYVVYLPYAFICAQLYILKRKGYIPILLAYIVSSCLYYQPATLITSVLLTGCVIAPLIAAVEGLEKLTGKKWNTRYLKKHSGIRLMTFAVLCPLITKCLLIFVGVHMPELTTGAMRIYFTTGTFSFNIVNLMHLTLSSLVFFSLFYDINRIALSGRYRAKLARQIKKHNNKKLTTWLLYVLFACVLYMALSQSSAYKDYFTGAIYPALLILFIHGSQKHNANIVMALWAVTVYLFAICIGDYITPASDPHFITSFMSVICIFSVALSYLAVTREENKNAIKKISYHNEINTASGLRNIRSLVNYCLENPRTAICVIEIDNLFLLDKYYGPAANIRVRREIAQELVRYDDLFYNVYDPGHNQLIVTLSPEIASIAVEQLHRILDRRNFSWSDIPMKFNFKMAWGELSARKDEEAHRFLHHLSFIAKDSSEKITCAMQYQQRQTQTIQAFQSRLQRVNSALFQNEIVLYRQPIRHADGEVYYEILTRLQSGEELLTPDIFLPVITEMNCCATFDLLVVKKCADYLAYDGLNEKISINIMPATLNEQGVADTIITILSGEHIDPSRIIFEITEEQTIGGSITAKDNLKKLSLAGFNLAIDDFGVHHSNFERLRNLDADIIKIDGQFIRDVTRNAVDQSIVTSICNIAGLKQMAVVAEFVETAEQYELLKKLGVKYFQGYFTGRPERCSLPQAELR